MSMDKKTARLRRATRARAKIKELGVYRLSVHRTPQHIYAQVFAPNTAQVVVAASTVDKELRPSLKHGGNAPGLRFLSLLISYSCSFRT